jgi:putative cardiolipin synthase
MPRWCQIGGGLRAAVAALGALLLGACGSLPAVVDRVEGHALAPDPASALVRIATASTPDPDESGFRLLPTGAYSLDARLQLARRAQRSLDLQYYVFDDDSTGRLLMNELRLAAARGVRVRLLVDDLYTTRTDHLLRALAAFPNAQVRVFNPFCCARSSGLLARFAVSLPHVRRLNHRMHNKLFIADGVMVVAGGRNIGDEYFMRGSMQNFVDLDAFAMGAIVRELAAIYDRYWNSTVVYPIEAVSTTAQTPEALRHAFDADMAATLPAALPELPTVDVLGYGPIGDELDAGRIGLIWGKARAYADPPDKRDKTAEEARKSSVAYDAMMSIWGARSELVITSPYLIPGKRGLESFAALRKSNVKVKVLTNSLAATDEPLVHTGYSRYRYDMLQLGVDMYELSPGRTKRSKRLGFGASSHGRLHAKTAVVDGQRSFIGSMNLDPRSETQNTELGIFIDSPELAREMLRIVRLSTLQGAYRLRLQENGPGIEWLATDDDQETVTNVEPESTPWLRLHNIIFGILVPEELL